MIYLGTSKGRRSRHRNLYSVKLAVVEREVQLFVIVGMGFERRFDFAVIYAEFSSHQISPKQNAKRTFWGTFPSKNYAI
jgi:hypothetical protein